MIWIVVLLVVALVLLGLAFLFFLSLPESRTAPGKRVRLMILATGLCIVASVGLGVTILVQENTGVDAGLSGGLESDARQWISRHSMLPPKPNQAGDNIKILRDGMSFLNSHPSVAETPEGSAVIQRYGTLPETPTRLLSVSEETQYYEGARAVYQLINNVAGQEPPAAN